ncbi:MAG: 1-phosphofructokinase family hexose kinase [Vicinamibacterales bacterium]
MPMETAERAIVTATPNPSIDVGTAVDLVEPDRKLRCDEPTREPGGGGLNVTRAIARLGGASLAFWARGGTTGALLHELLDGEGVLHRPIPMMGSVRESFAVLERASGRQFRFGTPGPTLAADALTAFIDELARLEPFPALVVGSGSLPPGVDERFYADLAEAVAAGGGRFILDTHGAPLRHALSTHCVHLIKPNLRELGALVGQELESDADIAEAARAMVLDRACDIVLVSLGAAGALVVTRDGADRIVAPTVPVRSRIGAGDSTVAGVALALARGQSLARAARFGVAAGAAAVMTPGTELCRREDVARLFARML